MKELLREYFSAIYNSNNYIFMECSSNEKKDFKIKINFQQVKVK